MEATNACQVLCAFCSRLLCESPSASLMERLREQRALLLEEPFSSVAPTAASELEHLLAGAGGEADVAEHDRNDGADGSFLADIRQDYTYLFYLVSISHTSPYESVYRTETREMFGPTTLKVREQYREQGFTVSAEGSLPDDHIGLELDFLGRLFARLAQEMKADDHAAADKTTETIRRFLSEHLLVFAPAYLRNFQARAQTPWYRAIGALTQAVVALLAQQMDAQPTDAPIDEEAFG
jgi:TorA maturation chaperone TorD